MEKKLLKNLQAYMEPLFDIPVTLYDDNTYKPNPPYIALGVTDVQIHPLLGANATIEGFCWIAFKDTQDPDKESDTVSVAVSECLQVQELYTALNAPLSGSDLRPAPGFTLEQLFLTGNETDEDEDGIDHFVKFEAYIANMD